MNILNINSINETVEMSFTGLEIHIILILMNQL